MWLGLLACGASACERTKVATSEPASVNATGAATTSGAAPKAPNLAAATSAAASATPAESARSAASDVSPRESAASPQPPISLEMRLVSDLKPGERRPLVVFLHGLGASAKVSFEVMPLEAMGKRDRVHVIAADGTLDSSGRRFWNAGKACCNFDDQPIDDVARLGALLDTWSKRPDVDPSRIYLAGYSNGGFMAHRLACERGDKLAAVVVLAGGVEIAGACPAQPKLSLLIMHGDADPIVSYAGGHVFQKPGLAPYLPVVEGFREWGKRLGCKRERAGTSLDLDAKLPGAETASLGFERCEFGDVELLSVHGGTHYIGSRQGVVEAAWKFLLSHRKR